MRLLTGKNILLALVGLVGLLVLGFIAWITGGSGWAFIAGIFLLGCTGVSVATMAGILTPPPLVRKILVWVGLICLVVIVWAGVRSWYYSYKAEEKLAKNPKLCQNEETERWVKIPAGFHKDSDGKCVEGPAPILQQRYLGPAEKPWSFRTLEIPANGIPVYLHSGWRGFTQGGAVTITTPGGKVFHDKPGVPTQLGFQPDGMYVFRGDPVGSKRSMVIYNRW